MEFGTFRRNDTKIRTYGTFRRNGTKIRTYGTFRRNGTKIRTYGTQGIISVSVPLGGSSLGKI